MDKRCQHSKNVKEANLDCISAHCSQRERFQTTIPGEKLANATLTVPKQNDKTRRERNKTNKALFKKTKLIN